MSRLTLFLLVVLAITGFGAAGAEVEAPIERVYVASYDGTFISGAVRKPAGDGLFPAILYIHGGLGGSGFRGAEGMLQGRVPRHFHERGYVGFATDYRRYHFGEDEIRDVLAAYRQLESLPYVDKNRIAVIGGSHGGYLAEMLASRIEPAATVSFAGLSDIEGMFYEAGAELRGRVSGWGAWMARMLELKNARNDPASEETAVRRIPGGNAALRPGSAGYEVAFELGWRYPGRPEALRAISPKENTATVKGPALYVVGGADPLRHAGKAWIEALRERGVTAEYSEHVDMPHGFYWGRGEDPPQQFHDALKVTTAFIERHLPQPAAGKLTVFSGEPRLLVVHGYSTSAHWWAMLQRKIDRFRPGRKVEVVMVNKGGTPIAKWMELETGGPTPAWQERIRPVLAGKGERPAIVLAQQSLQWVFGDRRGGIRDAADEASIMRGADAILDYARLLRHDGADAVFLATHIYKTGMEPAIGNERLALDAALARGMERFHAGPDVWAPTSKVWPQAFARDKVHPNSIGAEIMAQHWFETLLAHDGLDVPAWSREEMQEAIAGKPLGLREKGRFAAVLKEWGVPLAAANPWR